MSFDVGDEQEVLLLGDYYSNLFPKRWGRCYSCLLLTTSRDTSSIK